jgi:hypothetical protein
VNRTTPHRETAAPPPGSDGLDVLGAWGPGELRRNIFVRTGENEAYDSGEPYCHQRAIARHAVPDAFVIRDNIVHDVRQPGPLPRDSTVDAETLMRRGADVLELMAQRPHLVESRFSVALQRGGGP